MMAVLVESVVRRCRVFVSPMAAINDLEPLPCPGGRLWDVICDTGSTTAFNPVHEYGLVGGFLLTLESRRVTSYPSLIIYCIPG